MAAEAWTPPPLPAAPPPPDAGAPERRRLRLEAELVRRGMTHAAVYGDREHSANLEYLSFFDPRFEEALLVLGADGGRPTLLVGNEGVAYAASSPLELDVVNVRELSLPGQPWRDAVGFEQAIAALGLGGGRVGLVGWKHFDEDGERSELPSYMVDALRAAIGPAGEVRNATGLLSRAPEGLRTRLEPGEIVEFEYAARLTAAAMRRGLAAVAPGAREADVAAAMALPALPLSMHPIVASGPRAALGLASATARRIEPGDPVVLAVGFRGALNARAGLALAAGEADGELGSRFLRELAAPYAEALAAWYARLELGVGGGELQAAIAAAIAGRFELLLNPGHLIHLEEWVDAPVREGSDVTLGSGTAIQCDVIPIAPSPGLAINAEDGLVLADAELRRELRAADPQLWERFERRRARLSAGLGVELAPEVLPMSDLCGEIAPFLLSPDAPLVRSDRGFAPAGGGAA